MRTHAKTMSSSEEQAREEQARRPTPQDWDARVERGLMHAPAWLRGAVEWLRAPSRFWVRLVAGILLILGGILRSCRFLACGCCRSASRSSPMMCHG